MVITPHILAGAAVGLKVDNYWLVAVLSLVVHYAMDYIPHNEYDIDDLYYGRRNKGMAFGFLKIIIDFIIGTSFILFFVEGDFYHILVGILFSMLPDVILFLPSIIYFPVPPVIQNFHLFINHFWSNKNIPKWVGYGSQVVVVLIAIWILS